MYAICHGVEQHLCNHVSTELISHFHNTTVYACRVQIKKKNLALTCCFLYYIARKVLNSIVEKIFIKRPLMSLSEKTKWALKSLSEETKWAPFM